MSNMTAIDISNMPDLLPLVEEVKATKKPRVLKRNGESVAMLMPVGTTPKRTNKTKTSIKDALALAGAWRDLPSDKMEEQLDRIRHGSKPTPPLTLDFS
jgi:hypothetical protein